MTRHDQQALAAGLSMLSLTDHATALKEIQEARRLVRDAAKKFDRLGHTEAQLRCMPALDSLDDILDVAS